jgi:hypothetical protein
MRLLWEEWSSWWKKNRGKEKDILVDLYLEQDDFKDQHTVDYVKIAEEHNNRHSCVIGRVWCQGELTPKPDPNKEEETYFDIIFDRHANALPKIMEYDDSGKKFGLDNKYLIFDKASSDYVHIFRKPEADSIYRLAESGMTRILIVDERIAECAHESGQCTSDATTLIGKGVSDKLLRRWHVCFAAGIYICTHLKFRDESRPLHDSIKHEAFPTMTVTLDEEGNLDKCAYELSKDDCGEIRIDDIDVLAIHQGILDRYYPLSQEKILEKFRAQVPFVVVESGRGIPVQVQNDPKTKYMPFTILRNHLMGARISKHALVQTIMGIFRR